MKRLFFVLLFLSSPLAHAETLSGVVRNINYGSHSFGLDQPPLVRVYVNASTQFELEKGKGTFQEVKEGDRVEIEASVVPGNIYNATRVKVLGSLAPVQDLSKNEINIQPSQKFLLGVGQTAILKEANKTVLKIKAVDFINTLCKQGYECSGTGDVGMRLKISRGGKSEEILLTSKDSRKPVNPVKISLFDYEFQLIEAGEDVVLLMVRPVGS